MVFIDIYSKISYVCYCGKCWWHVDNLPGILTCVVQFLKKMSDGDSGIGICDCFVEIILKISSIEILVHFWAI